MKKYFLLFFLFFLSSLLPAQTAIQQKSIKKLRTEIETLKKDTDMIHASWSLCVMETNTGIIVEEYNSATSLTPASTQKIVTTAAGLSLLGPNYFYRTTLAYDGTFDSVGGIIKGNLYIIGSGDPTLQSIYFQEDKDSVPLVKKWAGLLKSKGIHTIEGSIIADASVFEDETVESNWAWGDMGNYYGAGASGLTYRDNQFTIYFNSGQKNDSTSITKIVPDLPDFNLVNYVKAAGTSDEAYIYGAPYSNFRYVTGTIPPNKAGFDVKGSLPDPPYLLTCDLRQALLTEGLSIKGEATSVRQLKLKNAYTYSPRKELFSSFSPPLEKIVYWTNMVSNNLLAEHILKTISLEKRGFGSSAGGIDELVKFWKSKGIDTKGLYLYDGCGLARANTITTKQLTNMLQVMTKDSAYLPFYNSLPVAGRTGTMKGLLKGTLAENNLRAKSGSFNHVRSFAGYVTAKNGTQLAFSIIANNFDCSSGDMRKKMERLMLLITELD